VVRPEALVCPAHAKPDLFFDFDKREERHANSEDQQTIRQWHSFGSKDALQGGQKGLSL